ncbi:Gfo/Idh/MocA family oxidoreductase [Pseudomaricurvus alcaniphilus]|uniref:Gfo/Idh/MocA family protein n=1 Tax=Pseudomaricurvus alcaniphilus TaxID=1166482 RepID=UPI001409B66A|nr:Gfo/Idh/MocA family oxidoreductase [Pseudomaricurvus alcaniphilus]NHN37356.1 Gfo/Idh/MocA family oxidoreductase [Pseudomaricurvus alcaniphilus]
MHSDKIRLGLIGGGSNSFIGVVHRIAANMGERYQLTGGVFGSDYQLSKEFAQQRGLDLSRTYADLDSFIQGELTRPASERIEVVSILTPNFLHYPMATQLINAGFHVICEKPITLSAAEAEEIESLVQQKQTVFALTHTYTGYPMVRQMREMIANGEIGKVQKVDAQYYQGWINPFIHEAEKRTAVWRLNPQKSGLSCCMGDVGIHAFNLVEYTTGLEVERVLGDIDTLYDNNPLDVDGTALFRTREGVRGIIRASQIATGEENNIAIAVYGDRGALKWEQESPTVLYHLREDKPLQIYKPGNAYNHDFTRQSTKIAPGHPEGLFDAMGNIYQGAAQAIRGEPYCGGAFPGVKDGVRGMKFVEAVLQSSRAGQVWVEL